MRPLSPEMAVVPVVVSVVSSEEPQAARRSVHSTTAKTRMKSPARCCRRQGRPDIPRDAAYSVPIRSPQRLGPDEARNSCATALANQEAGPAAVLVDVLRLRPRLRSGVRAHADRLGACPYDKRNR